MITVVVPSHSRVGPLARLLDALGDQTTQDFDVVVVLDGSTDGSDRMLASRRDRYRLRWQWQPRRGAAAARNAGVRLAEAPVMLFLDDDVVPEPGCVAAYAAHHAAGNRPVVVVGDCPVVLPARPRPHDLGGWAWWVDFNHRRAGSPASYRDVCAGNLSVPRELFVAVGGFDEGFTGYGAEDWELGVRLLAAGVDVVVEPGAVAHHHRRHSIADLLAHARSEGRADVHFARRHPDVVPSLRLRYPPRFEVFGDVGACERIVRRAGWRLPLVQPLRRFWRVLDDARARAYWLGVVDAVGSRAGYDALVGGTPVAGTVVDLAVGVPGRLHAPEGVPCEVEVRCGGEILGHVRLGPRAGRHRAEVAALIARDLTAGILLMDGAIPASAP